MRGGALNNMSSVCIQGGTPRPLGGHQPNAIMELSSPMSASQFNSVLLKHKAVDEEDSNNFGINYGGDIYTSSSESDHSENIQSWPLRTTSDVPSDVYELTKKNSQARVDLVKSIRFCKSLIDIDERDENSEQTSNVNSDGKVKTFKCKQCKFIAFTKEDLWNHTREHIPPEKRLPCTKCPFVTEYKHHMEYHLRNHAGSKPFKCRECNYSCVNKSMLNSHLKSHSNVHQYSCLNCNYNTKYCHSLKLHLRKYKHKPGIVLNPDGTPNPLPIIDVYGTRRGPKLRVQEQKSVRKTSGESQLMPLFHRFMLNTPHVQLPIPDSPFTGFTIFPGFHETLLNPALLHNLQKIIKEAQNRSQFENTSHRRSSENLRADEMEVLDLSKPEIPRSKNRRKGRAFKLVPAEENSSNEEETIIFPNVEVVESQESIMGPQNVNEILNDNKDNYTCQFCKIDFGDPILYTMHMGYHDFNNPFRCNMCGNECEDKVSFFIHIARTSHS